MDGSIIRKRKQKPNISKELVSWTLACILNQEYKKLKFYCWEQQFLGSLTHFSSNTSIRPSLGYIFRLNMEILPRSKRVIMGENGGIV